MSCLSTNHLKKPPEAPPLPADGVQASVPAGMPEQTPAAAPKYTGSAVRFSMKP
jgi:hypothetical protein